jgi:diguanylate cyclase (GGDEF)-like protein
VVVHVLIADDDPVARTVLRHAVQRLGHTTRIVDDGEAAWAVYNEGEIDVILSDGIMPKVGGLELCRRVRACDRFAYFILISSLEDKRSRLDGMRAGADDYLTKPLDRVELEMRMIAAERVTGLQRRIEAQRAELFRQGRVDALTGTKNRLALQEDLPKLHARLIRHGHPYSVVMLDVDHFKRFNDTQGHLAGDQVLRRVSENLNDCLRTSDSCYRFGGEEFCVVLPDTQLDAAAVVAERLRAAVHELGEPHPTGDAGVVTVSVGVALADPAKGVDDLLRAADQALYAAKDAGRNCVRTAIAALKLMEG